MSFSVCAATQRIVVLLGRNNKVRATVAVSSFSLPSSPSSVLFSLSTSASSSSESVQHVRCSSSSSTRSTSFLQPTKIYHLDLKKPSRNNDDSDGNNSDCSSFGALKRHRILEWTTANDDDDKNTVSSSLPASSSTSSHSHHPYVVFFHANSVGPGPWAPIIRRLLQSSSSSSSSSDENDNDNDRLQTCLAVESRGHGETQVVPNNIYPSVSEEKKEESSSSTTTTTILEEDARYYRWELFAQDFTRIIEALTEQYQGQPPSAIVTHSFSGDCALLSMLSSSASSGAVQENLQLPRLILLDPVLANHEGVTSGATRLATGTRRLGERELCDDKFGTSSTSVVEGYQTVLQNSGMLYDLNDKIDNTLDDEAMAAFEEYAIEEGGSSSTSTTTTTTTHDASTKKNTQQQQQQRRSCWRLQCHRNVEAAIYQNRISIGAILEEGIKQQQQQQDDTTTPSTTASNSDVQLVFSARRRGKRDEQDSIFDKDWREAQRVMSSLTRSDNNNNNNNSASSSSSKLHLLDGVGHFLVLENPELVADKLQELLPFHFSS